MIVFLYGVNSNMLISVELLTTNNELMLTYIFSLTVHLMKQNSYFY